MDVQKILIALQHTYNPVEAQRKEAEAHLKQKGHLANEKLIETQDQFAKWETAPGYIVALLQIVAANEVDVAVRQAASINLKNMTKKWRPRPSSDPSDPPPLDFPESDRHTVKENLLEALVHAPPLVRSQLASAVSIICESDFPAKWESFLPKIAQFITSQNLAYMHGALTALLMAFKRFTYLTSGKKREPLSNAVKQIFPLLLQLFSALSINDSLESAALQRLLCKIFYYTINSGIPAYLVEGDTLGKWIALFTVLLEKPVPEEIQPRDLSERPDFPWWGAKKWAARIMERCIRRYGKPRRVDKKSNKRFAMAFSQIYSVKVMESLLRVMSIKRGGGGYLPDKFTQTTLCYLRMCLRYGLTHVVLKPHLDIFTQEILFPYLCLSDLDKELWESDPVEYLRKEFDPIQEYHNPRTESINFITDLVMYRGKGPLNKFMGFIVNLLVKYSSTPENARNYREKDGCLHAIGALSSWLKHVPEYKANLERMLFVHVFPEFSSPFGFLRARACWIFSQFYNVRFQNPENFRGAVQKVLSMMHDPELPVRVQAGLALRFIILAKNSEDLLRPFLPQILEAVFKLMNEIDSDDLVATLERLIDHFGPEMAPYSIQLTQRLTEAFMKFYKNADEDDDTSAAAASECLMALRSLLRGIRHMPQIYVQVNPIILGMLMETLNENSIEYFEELLRIMTFCTFYGDPKVMWPCFQLIYNAFDLWASDFIDDMVPPLDNLISKDTETFLAHPPYLDMIVNMYRKLVGTMDSDEADAGQSAELIESVLHNCRGRVDRVLPDIIAITVKRLTTSCEDKDFRILLLEVIANTLYYNPGLTLQIMEAQGLTQTVFTTWLGAIPSFKRQFDIKLIVLGLSAIFELRLSQLPPLVQQGANAILAALVKLLKKSEVLKKEYEDHLLDKEHEKATRDKEDREKQQQQPQQPQQPNGADHQPLDEDSDEEVDMQEVPDDQDVDAVDSDDEDMDLAMLSSNVQQIMNEDAPIADLSDGSSSEAEVEGEEVEGEEEEGDEELEDEDDEEEEDDEEYDDDDDEYITPIDRVDELIYFASKMHGLLANDGPTFQGLMGTLKAEDQKELQRLVESAKGREVENAQKEQQRLLKLQQKGAAK